MTECDGPFGNDNLEFLDECFEAIQGGLRHAEHALQTHGDRIL
jgi:hypothetical protein